MVESTRALLVLGQSPFPLELIDKDCRVLYYNHAYAAAFLDEPVEVLDRPSPVLPLLLGENSRSVVLEALGPGLPWKGEVQVTTPRKQLPVRITIFCVHEAGAAAEFAVYYEDITTEIAAREALTQQQELTALRSRQAQMGELLSLIAHQWRQPLTVVMSLIGNVQLRAQLGNLDNDYLKTKLERMAETIQFLSETIDSFRDFHASSKQKSEEDLVALARKAVDLLLPSLEKAGVQIEFEGPPRLNLPVYRGEFQQLVVELVNSARDALAGTGGTLKIELVRDGARVLLRVGSSGRGTVESNSGSELGLSMAKTIVESHHGGRFTMTTSARWTSLTAAFPVEP